MTPGIPGMTRDVTSLCIGTSPLGGGMADHYGHDVSEERAEATIETALRSPIRFMDTSNGYGESERRIGRVISRNGIDPDFVIASKSDALGRDYSGPRVRASFEESRERLGVERFDLYYLHDPEFFAWEEITAPGGPVDTIVALKHEGLVDAVGVAGGDPETIRRYVDLGVFDAVLNHNRYTLLDRTSEPLIQRCLELGVAFVNAAPFASGLLARPNDATVRYQYRRPEDHVVEATGQLADLCAEYGVELPAVALQFSTRDARISSTVVGVSRPERIAQLLEYDAAMIPDELWERIDAAVDRYLA